eukprot:32025_1
MIYLKHVCGMKRHLGPENHEQTSTIWSCMFYFLIFCEKLVMGKHLTMIIMYGMVMKILWNDHGMIIWLCCCGFIWFQWSWDIRLWLCVDCGHYEHIKGKEADNKEDVYGQGVYGKGVCGKEVCGKGVYAKGVYGKEVYVEKAYDKAVGGKTVYGLTYDKGVYDGEKVNDKKSGDDIKKGGATK